MTATNTMRWAGPAAMLGGLLWILAYGLEVLAGATTGEQIGEYSNQSGLNLIYLLMVHAALVLLGIGLVGLRARLGGRSKKLGIAGLSLACIAIAMGAVNPVVRIGLLAFFGILGVVGGSLVLGIAALRTGALPRWARPLPLLVGIMFFPLIFLTFPLESILPSYATSNFPFPITGAVWVAIGYAMLASRAAETDRSVPAAA